MQIYKITKGNFALENTRDIRPHENNLRFHIKIEDKYYEYAIDNINKNTINVRCVIGKQKFRQKHKRGFLNKYSWVVELTVTLRKSVSPTLRAGPVGPRVLILRTCHVIGSRMNTGLIAYSKRSCNIKSNFHFRFPFPVKAVFKISFPVWADIIKMCRIKFQGESFETFFIYEVVKYPENGDLGVVGPPGPARSVTVNYDDC